MGAGLVMGELTDSGALQPLACSVPGVTARQRQRRYGGRRFEQRLYECGNGLALGARRGGPLHLADGDTWEVCTFDERRVVVGRSVGWVDEATLERAVRRLVAWPGTEDVAR